MWVIVVGRTMRSPVPLMFMLNYLDDVADGVGEADIVMVTSVVTTSSWARRSSEQQNPQFNM